MNFDQEYENTVNSGVSVETAKDLKKSVDLLTNILVDDKGNIVDMSDKDGRRELTRAIKNLPDVKIDNESMLELKRETSKIDRIKDDLCNAIPPLVKKIEDMKKDILDAANGAAAILEKATSFYKWGIIVGLIGLGLLASGLWISGKASLKYYESDNLLKENKKEEKRLQDVANKYENEINFGLYMKKRNPKTYSNWLLEEEILKR